MFKRQETGSTVCRSCGLLVGVNDQECYNCGAKNPALWGYAHLLRRLGDDLGFVNLITIGCVLLYVFSLIADPQGIRGGGFLGFLSPGSRGLFLFGASGAVPFFEFGRWWTVLSAAWLHGGLLHVGFNMLWVRQLAPATAEIYGAGRTIIIYTVSSIVAFFLSSLAGLVLGGIPVIGGARFTVGASAAIFGLLGALVYSGKRGGSSYIGRQARNYAVLLALFGFISSLTLGIGIDNWAHGGGFLGGYIVASLLDPMKPERLNHLFVALACLIATFAAIVVSIVTGLRYL
jgi:rhomboid protease GluP